MPPAHQALAADALPLLYGVQEMTTIEAREPAPDLVSMAKEDAWI